MEDLKTFQAEAKRIRDEFYEEMVLFKCFASALLLWACSTGESGLNECEKDIKDPVGK
jgi:hypothetical protein